jgi:hypothetical protein
MHCHESDLTPNPDVRPARVVETKDVAFDLRGGSRRNVQIILYLNLSRRHLISDERECGGVHYGATFDGDDFSG